MPSLSRRHQNVLEYEPMLEHFAIERSRLMRAPMSAAAFTAVSVFFLLGRGLALADTAQDQYVQELHAESIGLENTDDRLVQNGSLMCSMLAHDDVITVANLAAPRAGLTVTQTAFQIGAAIKYLCPEQVWQIRELHDADPAVPGVRSAIAGFGS